MATRRQFLLGVAAAGAARVLSGCGGGGDGQSSGATSSVDNGAGQPMTGAQPSTGGAKNVASTPNVTPQQPAAAAALPFFGINVHLLATYAPLPAWLSSTYVNTCADLGVGTLRTNISTAASAAALVPYFQTFAASNIEPFVVIDQGISLVASYTANYSAGYALGKSIATPLNGHCRYFECGNELDYACRVDFLTPGALNPVDGKPVDGSVPTDYLPTSIEAMRGWTAGLRDGIKSVIPDAQCGYASGVAYSNVVADMLCNGKDTTGAVTQPPISLDFIGVHWYSSQNDILAAGPSTHSNQFVNVLQQLNAVTGRKPIVVSEFGTWASAASQAQYLSSQFDVWRTQRAQYNIIGAIYYALFPNPTDQGETTAMNWGLIQDDGVTHKPAYAAYKRYTAAYPI
jgi:hypothetical protein